MGDPFTVVSVKTVKSVRTVKTADRRVGAGGGARTVRSGKWQIPGGTRRLGLTTSGGDTCQ